MKLKIGRHEYDITDKDEFMDNGSCVQLLTQSKECSIWGQRGDPVLSKRAIKEISGFERKEFPDHCWGERVSVFTLDIK